MEKQQKSEVREKTNPFFKKKSDRYVSADNFTELKILLETKVKKKCQ